MQNDDYNPVADFRPMDPKEILESILSLLLLVSHDSRDWLSQSASRLLMDAAQRVSPVREDAPGELLGNLKGFVISRLEDYQFLLAKAQDAPMTPEEQACVASMAAEVQEGLDKFNRECSRCGGVHEHAHFQDTAQGPDPDAVPGAPSEESSATPPDGPTPPPHLN